MTCTEVKMHTLHITATAQSFALVLVAEGVSVSPGQNFTAHVFLHIMSCLITNNMGYSRLIMWCSVM